MNAKRIGLVMASTLVVTILGVFVLPRDLKVYRAVLINDSPNVVYSHIVDLKHWNQWWVTVDSTEQVTISDDNLRRDWFDGGTFVVIDTKDNKRIDYEIQQTDNNGAGNISLTKVDSGTLVTWNHEQTARWLPHQRLYDWSARASSALEIQNGLDGLKTRIEHRATSQPDSP